MLTRRCKLADRVKLRLGNALDLPYSDQTFDVVWCQNATMNIADKAGLLAGVYRVLKPGGLFTATEYSVGPAGDIIFPVPWAYDASADYLALRAAALGRALRRSCQKGRASANTHRVGSHLGSRRWCESVANSGG